MAEVKHSGKSMEQKISDRLKPSCSPDADIQVTKGSGPTRTVTAIHHSGQGGAAQRVDLEKGGIKSGLGNPGEGSITGHKRDVV
jgi:hypothetical protein